MRIITSLLLLLLSSAAWAVPVGGGDSAYSNLTASALNPAVVPVNEISGTLYFDASAPLSDSATVIVTAYNSSGVPIGSKSYTNPYSGSITACSCIDFDLTTNLTEAAFTLGITSETSTFDVTEAMNVQIKNINGEKEVVSGLIVAGEVGGDQCITNPTLEGCPCQPPLIGDTYPNCSEPPPYEGDFGLVYTRVARANVQNPNPGYEYMDDQSNAQHMADVSRHYYNFTESDIVYNDLDGNEIVIENCSTDDERICAAVEAKVNPAGTEIVYALVYGNTTLNFAPNHPDVTMLGVVAGARIIRYTLPDGPKVVIPGQAEGVMNRYPEWINNNKIVYTSDAAGWYPSRTSKPMHRGFYQNGNTRMPGVLDEIYNNRFSSTLHTMNIDGSDVKNITPHDMMAIRPFVSSDGRIYYSCWQVGAWKNNIKGTIDNPSSFPGTSTNMYWVCSTDQWGGDHTSVLGAHIGYYPAYTSVSGRAVGSDILALRNVAEDSNGNLYVTSYYRANHKGLGWVFKWAMDDPHVEGCSTAPTTKSIDGEAAGCDTSKWAAGTGQFIPLDTFDNVTPYGQGFDNPTQRSLLNNKIMGKAGYASALPNGSLMVSHGRGWCYTGQGLGINENTEYLGDEPTCDVGIRQIKVDRVTDPFDLTQMIPIVDSPDYHEWDADLVAPYSAIYPGKDMPDQQDPYSGSACYLNIVDATKAEIYSWPGGNDAWQEETYNCSKMGCKAYGVDFESSIAAIRLWEQEQWTERTGPDGRDAYLGNAMYRTSRISDTPLEADGSVRIQVPCDTPYTMGAVNANGEVIAKDDMHQSLRPGEERSCHGCHDAHSQERWDELGGVSAESRFVNTIAAGTDPALVNLNERVTFTEDILPIINNRCVSCHTDFIPYRDNNRLYDAIALDYEGMDLSPRYQNAGGPTEGTGVINVFIDEPGTGYAVGETLDFSQGAGSGAQGSISEVGPSGEIIAISLPVAGNGYFSGDDPVTVNTTSGTGANLWLQTRAKNVYHGNTSHWVHKFSTDSLFYWKCVNERRDGRTDLTYPDDIDFGADHPTTATAEECNLIARWIDAGAEETAE